MQGKKEMLAKACRYTGLTAILRALPKSPALIILNYHRIGDAEATPYDSGVFSSTAAEFDWQVGYLKQHYPILTLPEACDLLEARTPLTRTSVLLTFDDGYLDNYTLAFPVLHRHGASATFFLPTAFVGTGHLPWWDQIAFIAKHTQRESIALTYPEPLRFDLTPPHRARSIMHILNAFKRPETADPERFIAGLEEACQCARPPAEAERCFLNWGEAREMQAGGMCFGSHTHTHELLAKLPAATQREELTTSREILEHELGNTIDTLAYPVGQPHTFSADTRAALESAHYRIAFSFYGGINLPAHIDRFDVLRVGVDPTDRSLFALQTATMAATHKSLL